MAERIENSIDKNQLKRARTVAVVLAIATVFILFGLSYAFIQKIEAEKTRKYCEGIQVERERFKLEAEQQRVLAEKAFIEVEVAKDRLRECEGRVKK